MKHVDPGAQGLRGPAIGLGCMGMSDFHGTSSEAEKMRVRDRAAPAPSVRAMLCKPQTGDYQVTRSRALRQVGPHFGPFGWLVV